MWRALDNIMDKSFHCGSVEGLKQKLRAQLLNCVSVKAWFVVLSRHSLLLSLPHPSQSPPVHSFQVTDPSWGSPDCAVLGVKVEECGSLLSDYVIGGWDTSPCCRPGVCVLDTLVALFLFKTFCNNTKERKMCNIKGQVSRSWHLRDYVIAKNPEKECNEF